MNLLLSSPQYNTSTFTGNIHLLTLQNWPVGEHWTTSCLPRVCFPQDFLAAMGYMQ